MSPFRFWSLGLHPTPPSPCEVCRACLPLFLCLFASQIGPMSFGLCPHLPKNALCSARKAASTRIEVKRISWQPRSDRGLFLRCGYLVHLVQLVKRQRQRTPLKDSLSGVETLANLLMRDLFWPPSSTAVAPFRYVASAWLALWLEVWQ